MSPQNLFIVSTAFPDDSLDPDSKDHNDTEDGRIDPDVTLDTFSTSDIIFFTYYYGLLLVLSAVNISGNGIILYGMVKHRHLRVPGNYFIFSLAVSDFSLGIIYPIYNVSHVEIDSIKNTLGEYFLKPQKRLENKLSLAPLKCTTIWSKIWNQVDNQSLSQLA